LNVDKKKSFIYHAKATRTTYLEADLIMPDANIIRKKYKNNLKCLYRVALTKIQLYILIKKIILRLVAKGCAAIREDGKLRADLYFLTTFKTNHNFKIGHGSSLVGLNENAPLIYLIHTDSIRD
jgi:hypothetical protein